jgi:ATP-binding cassette subfamily F protein 3
MLLLDEPTNHLSIGAVLWLARELTTSSVWAERIVMIVSHDRVFLDEVCTDVLHISGAARRLTQSHGNYSMWAKRRATQQKTFERTAAVRAAEIEKLKEFAGHGYRYGGSSSAINKMKMKEKQAEKLEEEAGAEEEALAALQEDAELPLTLKAGGELSGFAVQLRDVGFGYDAKRPPLFTGAELGIDSKSRVVLLGENGLGKTTLVKLMLGTLEPSSGEVHRAGQARVGLVNQHHADQLDLTLTPLQFLMDKFPGDGSYAHEQALRSHLHGAGVLSEHQVLPASALSGGQRSRVALAAVSYAAPHVLILDEPTNNLDLESVAALADCVERFEGGVVLVGHDQYFVGRVAKEVWAVEDGRLRKQGSFEAYRKVQLAKIHAEQP